jgi:PncC family amidohydrolase
MRAEILTIGDEICRGDIVDTNSAHLAELLWTLEITTRWMTSCKDDRDDIASALTQAVARADLVVCSSSLGPTEGGLMVAVVSELAGVAAVSASQLRQVRVPSDARVSPNPAGVAPGFEVPIRGVPVVCLPAVLNEVHAILGASLRQRFAELREATGSFVRRAHRTVRVFGCSEAWVSQACRGLVFSYGASVHYQVKFPEILVQLAVIDPVDHADIRQLIEIDRKLQARLGGYIYGEGNETLVDRTVRRLIEAGRTVATAESCTGGMIGELLTRRPDSSRTFLGGAIVYSNAEQTRQLGVRPETLAAHGAVSEETVREMAEGARARFGADFAVAASGILGLDGGTSEPVGTVWLALASAAGVATKKLGLPGARDQIRTLASWWALKLLDEAA